MKKLVIYSLSSIVSLVASSSSVYLGLKIADNFKTASVEDDETVNIIDDTEDDISGNDEDEPVIEKSNFSKMVSYLATAKEIKASSINLNLYATSLSSPVTLSLTDTTIDISNKSQFNLKSSINVTYGNINETVLISYEGDTKTAFLTYGSKGFMLSISPTINGILSLLKTIGINVPSSIDGGDFDVSSLSSVLDDESISVVESNTIDGFGYTLTFPNLVIGKLNLSGLSLFLESDKDCNLKTVSINKTQGNDGKIKLSDSLSLSFSANLSASSNSSYTKNDSSNYNDITSSTGSIITTITKMVEEKKVDASFSLKLTDNSNKTNLSSTVDGYLKADVSKVSFEDLTKGEYELQLNHYNNTETLNNISAYYNNATTYLKINDLFKGKVTNSTIDDLFKLITNAENKQIFSSVTEELNMVLSKIDLSKLKSYDLNTYKSFIKDFYMDNSKLSITLNASSFSLGDYDIVLSFYFDDEKITSLQLEGLKYQNYAIDLSLNFTFPSSINFSPIDNSYKDYQGMVPIFNSILNYVNKRKISADYSLIYSSSSSDSYTVSGKIDVDLSNVSTLSISEGGLNCGNYHLTFNTKFKDNSQDLNLIFQDHNLYFDYNSGVFKQSILDTNIDMMKKVISSHSSMEDSLSSINKLLSEIKSSKQYQEDIAKLKSGSLTPLSSFISIDKDNLDADKLIVKLNTPYILQNTSYENKVGSITLTIDNNDKEIENISINTLIDQKNSISLSLNLHDYSDYYLLSADDKSLYKEITTADKLLESFYSLPIVNQKEFSLKLAGKVLDDQNRTVAEIASNSGIAVNANDTDNLEAYGNLTISHPSLDKLLSSSSLDYDKYANQKIRFKYQTLKEGSTLDGQFVAEYNDNMHIVIKSSTILDVLNNVKSADSSTNLLHRYLKVLSDTSSQTGSGLTDLIRSKDPTKLLEYPYITKVDILSDRVDIVLDGKLLDSSAKGVNQYISLYYTNDDNPHITKATIKGELSSKKIEATIALDDFTAIADPSVQSESNPSAMLLYNDDTKGKFVDLNGFSMLSKCLVDTTENNYFNLSGSLNAEVTILALFGMTLSTWIDARITVFDEHAYAYLSFNNDPSLNDDGSLKSLQSSSSSDYYKTEFFISEKEIEVCKTVHSGKNLVSEVFKTDSETFLGDAMYYILTYILNVDNKTGGTVAMANVYDSVNSSSSSSDKDSVHLTDDFSTCISTNTRYVDDPTNPYFHLDIDLEKVFDGTLSKKDLSLKNTTVDVYHQVASGSSSRTPLSKLKLNTTLGYSGLVSIKFSLVMNASLSNISATDAKSSSYMGRYYDFTTAFKNNFGGFTPFSNANDTFSTGLPLYDITGYNINKPLWFFKQPYSYTLKDNSSSAKRTFNSSNVSEQNKVFICY